MRFSLLLKFMGASVFTEYVYPSVTKGMWFEVQEIAGEWLVWVGNLHIVVTPRNWRTKREEYLAKRASAVSGSHEAEYPATYRVGVGGVEAR
jgi:hypothetical protein